MSRTKQAERFLAASRLGSLLTRFETWRGLLVLTYHRIGDGSNSALDRRLWSATSDALDAQLAFLKGRFDVIRPDQVIDVARQPRGRHLMITFDDGYRDNYDLAFPILKSHGLSATFFLATGLLESTALSWWDEIAWMVRSSSRSGLPAAGWLRQAVLFDEPERDQTIQSLQQTYRSIPGDRTNAYLDFLAEETGSGRGQPVDTQNTWMTWDIVREMHSAGMTIGGHSVSHPVLGRLTPAEQKGELSQCALKLQAELGQPMRYFAYPDGSRESFNEVTRALLRNHAVELAFSCYGGYHRGGDLDPYDVPRTTIGRDMGLQVFSTLLTIPQVIEPARAWGSRRRARAAEKGAR